MISSFGDTKTEKYYRTKEHKVLSKLGLITRAVVMLDIMDAVDSLADLKNGCFPPDVRVHKLKGEYAGFLAIDIHKVLGMRIIFKFENNLFEYVSIINYHKG
jgi:plasmid maintenance system killer protein